MRDGEITPQRTFVYEGKKKKKKKKEKKEKEERKERKGGRSKKNDRSTEMRVGFFRIF